MSVRNVCIGGRGSPAGKSLPPIQTLRTLIADHLPLTFPQREQLTKRLPSVVINLPHDQFSEWMHKQSVGPYLMPLRTTVRALRDQAVTSASSYTRTLREGHYRGRGQIFRALDCIELQLTLRMIDLLTQHSIVSSVIWLHDGIWISPPLFS